LIYSVNLLFVIPSLIYFSTSRSQDYTRNSYITKR